MSLRVLCILLLCISSPIGPVVGGWARNLYVHPAIKKLPMLICEVLLLFCLSLSLQAGYVLSWECIGYSPQYANLYPRK